MANNFQGYPPLGGAVDGMPEPDRMMPRYREYVALPEGNIEIILPMVPICETSLADLQDHFALLIKKLRRRNEGQPIKRRRRKSEPLSGVQSTPVYDSREKAVATES